MSRPKISRELAGKALMEALSGQASGSGTAAANLGALLGKSAGAPAGSAMAEIERLKREAAAAPASSNGGRLKPSEELRAVIREELAALLNGLKSGTGEEG
ncbi:MAG TPA: hypothetical protein VEB66_18045 [Opitutaceae bacterium]|nr:hypothetical protein [Opitutaceae bacterium]